MKKASVREFVSEESLKFQLYLLKYSNQLKNISQYSEEELITNWESITNKKVNKYLNEAQNPKFKNKIAQEAIKWNIDYIRNLPVPKTKDIISKDFEKARQNYIESLKKRIEENKKGTKKLDEELLEYAKNVELTEDISREKFGEMLLIMLDNLVTMPSFSGYSENWRTEFFSNAIEKTFLYLDNFDEHLKSKRTGKNSSAFAYITQICYNAFINIINIRKKEEKFLKRTISLESFRMDGVEDNTSKEKEYSIVPENQNTLEIETDKILETVEEVMKSNSIIEHNKKIDNEIEHLSLITDEKDKTEDYDRYIEGLKKRKKPLIFKNKYDVVKIIKSEDLMINEIPPHEGFDLILTNKKEKK